MARHYIGVASRGITVLRNIRTDKTGEPLLLLDEDEIARVVVNFSGYLETGETISSASIEPTGVTATASTSSPNVTLTVSGSGYDGKITLVVTMSTGDKWRSIIRVRKTERQGDETLVISDYA